MLKNAAAAALMQDARQMQAAGVRQLDAGDWRDAAAKAWLAARNASKALLLEVNGADSPRTPNISAGIRALAHRRGGQWPYFSNHLSVLAYQLHSEAFYGGIYVDDIPDLVRGVADYIALAAELTAGDPAIFPGNPAKR